MDGKLTGEALRRLLRTYRYRVLGVALFTLLASWQVLSSVAIIDRERWASPALILGALSHDLLNGAQGYTDQNGAKSLLYHAGRTLMRWAIGFSLAAAAGIGAGFALGRSNTTYALGYPIVNLLRGLPSAALWPVCAVLIGYGLTSQLAVLVFGTFWPILLNTTAAVRSIPQEALDSIAFMKLGRSQRSRVHLRWASPGICTGLEIGCAVAFLLAVTVEIIFPANGGLGWYIGVHEGVGEQAQMFAGLSLVALLGFSLNTLLSSLRSRLVFWEADTRGTGNWIPARVTRVASMFLPQSVRKMLAARSLARLRLDQRMAAVFSADHVSEEIRRQLRVPFSIRVLHTSNPPYMYPDDLELLSGNGGSHEEIYQRDIAIMASTGHDTTLKPFLFSRSWINMTRLADTERNLVLGKNDTIGDILAKRKPDCDYEELGYDRLISEGFGVIFEAGGAIEVVQRRRLIRVRGRPTVLIHEFAPAHKGEALKR